MQPVAHTAPLLTTGRLVLRRFAIEDVPLYRAICADPVVMQYLGGPWSAARTEQVMAEANLGAETGSGMVAIERQSDGAFLGAAGLSVEQWYPQDVQVGWRLAREHWGQGYATEAGQAWLDYAFSKLRLHRVIAMADTPNIRSLAVMRRLGMVVDHAATLTDGDDVFEATVCAITRPVWEAARRA